MPQSTITMDTMTKSKELEKKMKRLKKKSNKIKDNHCQSRDFRLLKEEIGKEIQLLILLIKKNLLQRVLKKPLNSSQNPIKDRWRKIKSTSKIQKSKKRSIKNQQPREHLASMNHYISKISSRVKIGSTLMNSNRKSKSYSKRRKKKGKRNVKKNRTRKSKIKKSPIIIKSPTAILPKEKIPEKKNLKNTPETGKIPMKDLIKERDPRRKRNTIIKIAPKIPGADLHPERILKISKNSLPSR